MDKNMAETKRLLIEDYNSIACSKAGYDARHSRDAEEPLAPVDLRLYQLALVHEGGVPEEDAKKRAKELEERYQSGDSHERQRLGNVLEGAFRGLVFSRTLQTESISIASGSINEVVVYRRP